MNMYRTQSDFFNQLGGGGYIEDPAAFYQHALASLGPMSKMSPPASLTEAMIRRGSGPDPMASTLHDTRLTPNPYADTSQGAGGYLLRGLYGRE